MLCGQRITTDSVVADLKAAKALLELACFLAYCCKNMHRTLVSSDAVSPYL